jgi:Family of unknown function (DUF6134)
MNPINRTIVFVLLWLAPLLAIPASKAPAEIWDFKVYLDDKPVGLHRFTLSGQPQERQVHSDARFNVKLLMISAYSYAHEAKESWLGDCLTGLKAKTDDNGKLTEVQGGREGSSFHLVTNKKQTELPECVWTFAYWHPGIIEQKSLLNPQTGEYLPVRFSVKGEERIKANGKEVNAKHYLLDAGKIQIELWYSTENQRWLALDSKLEGGRRLRYRIE